MRSNCLFWAARQWRRVWDGDWYFWARRTRQTTGSGRRGWWPHVGIAPELPPTAESFVPTAEEEARLQARPRWRRFFPPLLFRGYVKRGDA